MVSIPYSNKKSSEETTSHPYDAAVLAKLQAGDSTLTRAALLQMKDPYWHGIAQMALSMPVEDRTATLTATLGAQKEHQPMLAAMAGVMIDAPLPDADAEAGAVGASRFVFHPASAIENMPPMQWLITKVLPARATSAMWGEAGTGKSFIALDLAACITTGIPWQGHPITTPGPVAYIAAEGLDGMKLRLRAWREQHGLRQGELDRLFMLGDAPQLLQPDDLTALMSALHALPEPPVLVVIDTLARTTAGADENGQQDMGLLVRAMDNIKCEFGAHVLTLHHANAEGSKMRGSTVLPGAFETVTKVNQSAGRMVTIECKKQKDGAQPFDNMLVHLKQVSFLDLPDLTTCIVIPADQAARPVADNHTRCLAALLTCMPGNKTLERWQGARFADWKKEAIRSGVPSGSFTDVRSKVLQYGWVEKAESGDYKPTKSGTLHLRIAGLWPDHLDAKSQLKVVPLAAGKDTEQDATNNTTETVVVQGTIDDVSEGGTE